MTLAEQVTAVETERDGYRATLEYIKTCLETPATADPRTRNDLTKHRLNGVIAQMYSTVCISLTTKGAR